MHGAGEALFQGLSGLGGGRQGDAGWRGRAQARQSRGAGACLRSPVLGAIDALTTVLRVVPHPGNAGVAQEVVQNWPTGQRFGLWIAAGNALLDLLDGEFLRAQERTSSQFDGVHCCHATRVEFHAAG